MLPEKENIKYFVTNTANTMSNVAMTVADGLVAIVTAIVMALAFIVESIDYRYKNDGDFRYYINRIRDAVAIGASAMIAFAAVGEFIIYWAYGHPIIGMWIALVMLVVDAFATNAMLNVDN